MIESLGGADVLGQFTQAVNSDLMILEFAQQLAQLARKSGASSARKKDV
jgi:hypothetical protein